MPADDNLQTIALNATAIALEAGEELLRHFRIPGLKVDTKLNESDIVTAADAASEQCIIKALHSLYPHHSILSEESGAGGEVSDWQWVIDPLDGTTNFAEGLPAFCVSMGVTYRGITKVGVVFAPYLHELYVAIEGEGASLNGKHIEARHNKLLERAVVATGFPVDKNINTDNNMDNLERVLPLVRGVRRLGSAALDLSYVGAGFLDAYWELNLHEWDVCAGELIAHEGGAICTRFRHDRGVSILAAPSEIFHQMLPLLSTTPR